MYVKLLTIASLSIVIAGAALFFTGGASAQSRDVEPALMPGEQAVNINASAFIPQDPSLGAKDIIKSISVGKGYYAALQLPQGSTIKRIGFVGKDNDNAAKMILYLYAQAYDSGTSNIVKQVGTLYLDANNSFQYKYSPRFTHSMKWHRAYYLRLWVDPKSGSAPNEQAFLYARVIYEPAP